MADPGVGGKTILVVDDDSGVLAIAEAVLARAGYSVIAFSNPLLALKKSREFEGDIDLLLTDVAMPEMDGVKLARQIQAERPQTGVLLMSGYMASASRFPLLNKPFAFNDLLTRVASIMAAAPPVPDVRPGHDGMSNARMDAARKKFLDSSSEFNKAAKEVPTGVPGPDGLAWLQNKAKLRRRAFAEYKQALEEARLQPATEDQDKPGEQK